MAECASRDLLNDPEFIIQGAWSDGTITESFGFDDEVTALHEAGKLLRSPHFEGDHVVIITRDGELMWDSRDPESLENWKRKYPGSKAATRRGVVREPNWQPGGTRIMMTGPDPTSDYALVQRMIGFYVTQKGLGDYVKGSAVPMGGGIWKFHTRPISVSKPRGRTVSREEEVSHAELSRMWQSKGVSEARRRKPVPVDMTQFASGFLDQLAADLSRELGGSKPEVIPGGFRWSEPNASAQFTTYSPEHNQKVVVVVSVFHENVGTEKRPVPKTAISIFSDEGLSEIDTYENIAHFNYAGADLRDMKKDVKWVWETVDGYAASWQDQDEGMEEKKKPRKRKTKAKKRSRR